MTTLSPLAAAQLAHAVYGIRTTDDVMRGVTQQLGGGGATQMAKSWNLEGGTVAHGTSGNVITEQSGFGLVLKGQSGRFENETVVVTRGTQTTADWVSNATTGVSPGPFGLGVHTGFNRIYKSVIEQVLPQVPSRGVVHVVGHSLGGSLANLIAARLSSSGERSLRLYTFGSPRVGLPPFSGLLQQRIGSENMYRVYSIADPVPMVPIYPFVHAPVTKDGIRVGNTTGLLSIDAHLMPTSYLIHTKNNNSWAGLQAASQDIYNLRRIDDLLKMAGNHSPIPGSSSVLWMLGKALQAIVDFAILKIGIKVMVFATVADTIAQLLVHAARLGREIGSRIKWFIEKALAWAGKGVVKGVEVTAKFLAWVIKLMLAPIGSLAARALDRLRS